MMKAKKMSIATFFLLLLAFNVSPALAAKKAGKIEYTLPGNIVDQSKGMYGTISLTFGGGIKGAPDYEDRTFSEGPVDYSGDEYYEYYWFDERTAIEWKAEVHYSYQVTGWQRYSSYTARWYSPQPTYNGKLVVIWNDGSTTTFSVGLSPLRIEEFTEEGYGEVEASFTLEQLIYWWDTGIQEWVYDRTEEQSDSYSGAGSFAASMLSIEFSAKVQSKGRPPLQGTLSLSDYRAIYDAWENSMFSVSGTIGPYDVNIYLSGR